MYYVIKLILCAAFGMCAMSFCDHNVVEFSILVALLAGILIAHNGDIKND